MFYLFFYHAGKDKYNMAESDVLLSFATNPQCTTFVGSIIKE